MAIATSDGRRGPVGTMKKLVSLVDRGAFDTIVYPQSEKSTELQPDFKPYHNFVTDVKVWPFTGVAEWGKRITFTVPQPWEADMLSWLALRIKPMHWFTPDLYKRIYGIQDWTYTDPAREWVWAESLGTVAIARAEMEVDGVIVEQWSGDWADIWAKTTMNLEKGAGWSDSVVGPVKGTEDGYVYCYLPFWFTRWLNASFPLVSCKGAVRFHITLRPFHEVVRMVDANKACTNGVDTDPDSPLGKTFRIRDWNFPFPKFFDKTVGLGVPTMESAELVCGTAQIDGDLRLAYRDRPHEIMMTPCQEIRYAEPLKYVVGVPNGETINISLPIYTEANGPIRQIFWFLRRKAAELRADWTNYSATLEGEADPTWNPVRPLLRRAQLMIGTAVWADQDEAWWRSQGALPLAGGIRVYGNYVYAYNFTEQPNLFDPAGSVNASRADIRLNLEIQQPVSAVNNEWEVVVFLVGVNWMRFENGLANQLFSD
jgi:hypothetical protein